MNESDNSVSKNGDQSDRVHMLASLVRGYAWCRIPSYWFYSETPDYLLVVELLDGRRFWRCLCSSVHTPDEIMLNWATCSPKKWRQQFKTSHGGEKTWNEYFDFWSLPTVKRR